MVDSCTEEAPNYHVAKRQVVEDILPQAQSLLNPSNIQESLFESK